MVRLLALRVMQAVLKAKRNAIIGRSLPKDARNVVDVGCGHFPNKFANIAMDRAENDDQQRGGLSLNKDRKGVTFVDIDLNCFPYPFADKQFDYLICTHVLEHIDDPVRTCAEFARIAKAGYLEVPYFAADIFVRNNDPIHRWLCMYSPRDHMLSFTNRDALVERFPPLQTGLIMRFFLQLRNVAYAWSDSINAQYWEPAARPTLPCDGAQSTKQAVNA